MVRLGMIFYTPLKKCTSTIRKLYYFGWNRNKPQESLHLHWVELLLVKSVLSKPQCIMMADHHCGPLWSLYISGLQNAICPCQFCLRVLQWDSRNSLKEENKYWIWTSVSFFNKEEAHQMKPHDCFHSLQSCSTRLPLVATMSQRVCVSSKRPKQFFNLYFYHKY